jgi:hypothetical protein
MVQRESIVCVTDSPTRPTISEEMGIVRILADSRYPLTVWTRLVHFTAALVLGRKRMTGNQLDSAGASDD